MKKMTKWEYEVTWILKNRMWCYELDSSSSGQGKVAKIANKITTLQFP